MVKPQLSLGPTSTFPTPHALHHLQVQQALGPFLYFDAIHGPKFPPKDTLRWALPKCCPSPRKGKESCRKCWAERTFQTKRGYSFTRHQEQVATYQTDEWDIKATSLPGSHTLRNRPLNLVCPQHALATLPPLTGLLWSGMALPVSLAVLHMLCPLWHPPASWCSASIRQGTCYSLHKGPAWHFPLGRSYFME